MVSNFEEKLNEDNGKNYELYAVTQRPPHMYHSWGSQNAWLRQITNPIIFFIYSRRTCYKKIDIRDNDWVWLRELSVKK